MIAPEIRTSQSDIQLERILINEFFPNPRASSSKLIFIFCFDNKTISRGEAIALETLVLSFDPLKLNASYILPFIHRIVFSRS